MTVTTFSKLLQQYKDGQTVTLKYDNTTYPLSPLFLGMVDNKLCVCTVPQVKVGNKDNEKIDMITNCRVNLLNGGENKLDVKIDVKNDVDNQKITFTLATRPPSFVLNKLEVEKDIAYLYIKDYVFKWENSSWINVNPNKLTTLNGLQTPQTPVNVELYKALLAILDIKLQLKIKIPMSTNDMSNSIGLGFYFHNNEFKIQALILDDIICIDENEEFIIDMLTGYRFRKAVGNKTVECSILRMNDSFLLSVDTNIQFNYKFEKKNGLIECLYIHNGIQIQTYSYIFMRRFWGNPVTISQEALKHFLNE